MIVNRADVLMAKADISTNKNDNKKFADLIGPTDPKLDRSIRERLVTARVGLLLKASFFGNLATRLKLINADEWCATAATDGRNFYYNTRFIDKLRPREVEFLFGHEVLHVVYDHFGRRGDREPQLWNIANDFCVNADLKKHRVGEFITTVPCLYDSKYDGMSSEEVYDDLYEHTDKISLQDLINKIVDEHLDGTGQEGNDSESGKRPAPLSEEEKAALRDEIKEAILSASKTCEAGSIPAGVRRVIQAMTEPKMNWRDLLRMQLESTIKSDFTWMKSSRKGWHVDAVMPGMQNNEMIDIAIAIDASGSISEIMLRDFLGEVQGIMEQFDSFRIHLFTFDTTAYNAVDYNSDNMDSICDYDVSGGGGTDFECIFQHLKDREIEPRRLVVFTDGCPFGSWGDEHYADTLWILHGTKSIEPPWGQFVYYDEN
jgi:predicted metal-dependent peptidase